MDSPTPRGPAWHRALIALGEWLQKGENLKVLLGFVCAALGAWMIIGGMRDRQRQEIALRGNTFQGGQAVAVSNGVIFTGFCGLGAGLYFIRARRSRS